MKVLKLQAENFKRLKAIELTADKDFNLITGANANGKSSLLDAILTAIQGIGKINEPIRKGEDKARIVLELDDLIIERTITDKGNYLTVTGKDQKTKYTSPQNLLDALYNKVAIDPVKFISQSDKEQSDTIIKAAGIEEKLNKLNTAYKEIYENRTFVNRDVTKLKASLGTEPLKADIVNVEELQKEYQNAYEILDQSNSRQREINYLQNSISDLEIKISAMQKDLKDYTQQLTQLKPIKITFDIEEIKERMNKATEQNRIAEKYKKWQKDIKQLEEVQSQSNNLTSELNEILNKKKQLLESSNLPLQGLGISEEGILTFNDILFKQCSSAEQLKIAMSISMALNDKLKVIIIREGSLLDNKNLSIIKDMAEKAGYQLWIEKVDESGIGIVIEDGEIKN